MVSIDATGSDGRVRNFARQGRYVAEVITSNTQRDLSKTQPVIEQGLFGEVRTVVRECCVRQSGSAVSSLNLIMNRVRCFVSNKMIAVNQARVGRFVT